MKLQSTMFAVAMMIGSFSAVGCARPERSAPVESAPVAAAEPQAAPEAPVATPAAPVTTPVKTVAAAPIQQLPAPVAQLPAPLPAPVQYAPYAPPAPRFENPGRAPRPDFTYLPGAWRWSGREYSWVPGHWEARRTGYDYQPSRWENVGGRWTQRDGYWKASVRVEADKHLPPRRAAAPADCDPPKPKHVKPRPASPTVQAKVSVTVKRS